MAIILCIETSTKVCSVALCVNGKTTALAEDNSAEYTHAEKLNLLIEEALSTSAFDKLDAIAVSEGPGSYTGLRIGVSAAKGIAFAKGIPLIAVNTLKAMSAAILDGEEDSLFVAMIDARRMEVYCAGYNGLGQMVFPTRAEVVTSDSFPEARAFRRVVLLGDGAPKSIETLKSRGFEINLQAAATAAGMAGLAQEKFDGKDFVDTAYFEPFYLKDFVAGKPKQTNNQ